MDVRQLPPALLRTTTPVVSEVEELALWMNDATPSQVLSALKNGFAPLLSDGISDTPFVRFFKRGVAHLLIVANEWGFGFDTWPDFSDDDKKDPLVCVFAAAIDARHHTFDLEAAFDENYHATSSKVFCPEDGIPWASCTYTQLTRTARQSLESRAVLVRLPDGTYEVPKSGPAVEASFTKGTACIQVERFRPRCGDGLYTLYFDVADCASEDVLAYEEMVVVLHECAPRVLKNAKFMMLFSTQPFTFSYLPRCDAVVLWACQDAVHVVLHVKHSSWMEINNNKSIHLTTYRVTLVDSPNGRVIEFSKLPRPLLRGVIRASHTKAGVFDYRGPRNLDILPCDDGTIVFQPRFNEQGGDVPVLMPGSSTVVKIEEHGSPSCDGYVDIEVVHA